MSHPACSATAPRVFVMSDIHTDFPENMSWCASLSDVAYKRDAVILGGDVSDDLRVLETTLVLFKRKFRHVFFTPGNHDLWIRGKEPKNGDSVGDAPFRDSLAKLEAVLSLCEACGVRTKPFLLAPSGDVLGGEHIDEHSDTVDGDDDRDSEDVDDGGGVWIVPVLAWHHASFDYEPDIPPSVRFVPPPEKVMSDFRLCAWPPPLDPADASVAGALDALNDTRQEWGAFLHKLRHGTRAERESPILSFSHFLPRLELCPEKRMLFYPNLPKAVGSDFILARIAPLATHGLSPNGKPNRTRTRESTCTCSGTRTSAGTRPWTACGTCRLRFRTRTSGDSGRAAWRSGRTPRGERSTCQSGRLIRKKSRHPRGRLRRRPMTSAGALRPPRRSACGTRSGVPGTASRVRARRGARDARRSGSSPR